MILNLDHTLRSVGSLESFTEAWFWFNQAGVHLGIELLRAPQRESNVQWMLKTTGLEVQALFNSQIF